MCQRTTGAMTRMAGSESVYTSTVDITPRSDSAAGGFVDTTTDNGTASDRLLVLWKQTDESDRQRFLYLVRREYLSRRRPPTPIDKPKLAKPRRRKPPRRPGITIR